MSPRKRDPRVAVAYIRVSTDDQVNGASAQRAAIDRWAKANGVAVAHWFEDRGVSGATPAVDRPGFRAALAALDGCEAGVLVVAKRDRLARDVIVGAVAERLVERLGAAIVSADGAGNGDGPEAALMRAMVGAFAAYERDLIRARTKAALAVMKARGERVGTVPYGYSAGRGGKLVPNDDEQAVLADVRRFGSTGMSQRDIVRALGARGVRGRTGAPLGRVQVARLLARAS